MPPKVKITKEDIINTAADIVRSEGEDSLNARSLALKLNCSTQPIFSNFRNMEELRAAVITFAGEIYADYVKEDIKSGKYPVYKSSGMAYIRFASTEPQLFKLLFMRDRTEENINEDPSFNKIIESLMNSLGLNREEALLFHLEIWSVVHGLAVMSATKYMKVDLNLASIVLTDVYQGLIKRFKENKDERI